jgi:DNA-binding protein YbaB
MQQKSARVQGQLRDLVTTVSSVDGAVTVTVNPEGVLSGLVLSPRAEGMSPAQIANQILQTYEMACSQASARTVEIMSGLVGENSEAMDFLRAQLPSGGPSE